ncbi:hypothetical protein J7E45_12100 [Microbacterium sp. ISL-59]|uniref:hypothetical protein n=1 Tax=Microbacterium sp. ISL-59 TaxID=2819159 RepID=UPI001BE93846|nr:hypothetical protein [Microbacterium sp. ISL-59]MBT2496349.1 hypothetical protein [Microbacterium sp. ISL-59]
MSEPQQPPAHLPAAPQYPGTHAFPAHASSAPPSAPATPAQPTADPAYPTAYPTAAPAHPAGVPGYPTSWPAAAGAPAAPAGSALGRTAFVIAVITLAVNLISSIVRLLIYTSDFGYGSAYAIDDAIGVISFFAYVVALVLGIIAARRPGARLLAGIAIGIAGAGALGMIFSWIGIAFLRFA